MRVLGSVLWLDYGYNYLNNFIVVRSLRLDVQRLNVWFSKMSKSRESYLDDFFTNLTKMIIKDDLLKTKRKQYEY